MLIGSWWVLNALPTIILPFKPVNSMHIRIPERLSPRLLFQLTCGTQLGLLLLPEGVWQCLKTFDCHELGRGCHWHLAQRGCCWTSCMAQGSPQPTKNDRAPNVTSAKIDEPSLKGLRWPKEPFCLEDLVTSICLLSNINAKPPLSGFMTRSHILSLGSELLSAEPDAAWLTC